MAKTSKIKKTLERIISKENFDKLEDFRDEAIWSSMTSEELDILATLFATWGKQQTIDGDPQAYRSFDIAAKIQPKNPEILVQQAHGHAFHVDNEEHLMIAINALVKATELDPTYYDAWKTWGMVLIRLGMLQQEPSLFQESQEKLAKAESLMGEKKEFDLYCYFARSYQLLGRLSGEPLDYHKALEYYRLLSEIAEVADPDIWVFYGDTIRELSQLLNKEVELYPEAVKWYQKALKIDPQHPFALLYTAYSYRNLYDMTDNQKYFDEAVLAFDKAINAGQDLAAFWVNWGRLFSSAGKRESVDKYLEKACECFLHADSCDPDNPFILIRWGETQLLYGINTERVDLIREGLKKLERSVELEPNEVFMRLVHGDALNDLGHYFHDERYYLQAMEAFRRGLSIDQQQPVLWYGLAVAHYGVGDIRSDFMLIEKATSYCSRVAEFSKHLGSDFLSEWGVMLLRLADMTGIRVFVEEAIDKFKRSLGGSFEAALQADETQIETIYHYACAWDYLGDHSQDPDHYERSIRLFHRALELSPNYAHAHFNMALTLTNLGVLNDDDEHLHRAIEHFQKLVQLNPEDDAAWYEWGHCLLQLAQMVEDPAHLDFALPVYAQAEAKLLHALGLGSLRALYTLACHYALTGNVSAAIHYLERADQAKTLPPLEDIMHDEWLAKIRETPSFRHFLWQITENSPTPPTEDLPF